MPDEGNCHEATHHHHRPARRHRRCRKRPLKGQSQGFDVSPVKLLLVITSIAALVAGVCLAFKGEAVAACGSFGLAALFVVMAHIGQIKESTWDKGAFKLVTRDVQQIQVGLKDLQQIMITMARSIATIAECSGRLGGVPDEVKNALFGRLGEALERIKIRDPAINTDLMSEVHQLVDFDYVHHILGGMILPDRDSYCVAEWKKLRHFGSVPTPEVLKAFLTTHGFDTDERLERVEDYRYYLRNRKHQRTADWDRRNKWGRLT